MRASARGRHRLLRLVLSVLLVGFNTAAPHVSRAADPSTRGDAPEYTRPLGIALDELEYPYPVQFLPLQIEGRDVRMAFMDVPPRDQSAAARHTVLLLHSKNFWGAYWRDTIRVLTDAGCRVIVPDQLGFGKSSKPDVHYSFDLLAENTVALLDQLKVDRVVVVGHSMGGMLASHLAAMYPQRVSRLILENPIGLEDYRLKGVPPTPLEKLYESELNKSTPELRNYLKLYFAQWRPEYETYVEVPARVRLSGEYPRWAYASALTTQMIYQQPVWHEFGLIRCPTLLVIGQSDRTTIGRGTVSPDVLKTLGNYPELGRAAQRDIAGSKLVEIENCGHIPHFEAPDKFHAAVLEFLK
jgi:pimeloyl-ACP methyl ester carboxylesterase